MLGVTSFGPQGWNKYAREGLETFVRHWPGKVVAYYESTPEVPPPELTGTLLNAVSTGKLALHNLFEDRHLLSVLRRAGKVPLFQGTTQDGKYNYHFDIWKFCRKTFAVRLAAETYSGPIFWIDADVRFTKDIPEEVLSGMLSEKPIAYLGRKGAPHSECGFIGFDTSIAEVRQLIVQWAGAYVDFTVLDLPGWHDCWVFDALVKHFQFPANNLTEKVSTGGGAEAVFEKSILGQYGTHLKGARKEGKRAA